MESNMKGLMFLFIVNLFYSCVTQYAPGSSLTSQQHDSVIVDADNLNEIHPNRNNFLTWLQTITGIGTTTTTTTTTYRPILLEPPTDCDKTCRCGLTNQKNRIVGGQSVHVNQFPWMAMLLYGPYFYCGGALINDRYVMTAAHCVHGFNQERISVRLLEHDTSTADESKTITIKVLYVVKHKNYDSNNYNNDIALLKLEKTVQMTDILRPVCLPELGKSFTGFEGIVTGWGATQSGGSISVTLQEVVVPILSNVDCRTKSGYKSDRITDNMLCAGYTSKGGKDSCQGDSGGPLHIKNITASDVHHIVGVVSWGEGCAKPNYPGVYSRVNRYDTWIRSNTKDACYCES